MEAKYCVDASHPALAGHFPGNPIVPGVVLLSYVEKTLLELTGQRLGAFPSVKFLQPLLPEQGFVVELKLVEAGLEQVTTGRFSCRLVESGQTLAEGKLSCIGRVAAEHA